MEPTKMGPLTGKLVLYNNSFIKKVLQYWSNSTYSLYYTVLYTNRHLFIWRKCWFTRSSQGIFNYITTPDIEVGFFCHMFPFKIFNQFNETSTK